MPGRISDNSQPWSEALELLDRVGGPDGGYLVRSELPDGRLLVEVWDRYTITFHVVVTKDGGIYEAPSGA